MVKFVIQYTTQIEFDTETGRRRMVGSYTTELGKGWTKKKKPSKPKKAKAEESRAKSDSEEF